MVVGRRHARGLAVVASLLLVSLLGVAASCGDAPTAPGVPCTTVMDSAGWQFLGLAPEAIGAVARTGDVLYAGTVGRGVWASACPAGRVGWQARGLDSITVRALIPVPGASAAPVYAAVAHATVNQPFTALVWRTDDAGRHWQPRDGGLGDRLNGHMDATSLFVDSVAPAHLVAGLGNALMVSTDAGTTWRVTFGDLAVAGGPEVMGIDGVHVGVASRLWIVGTTGAGITFADWSADGGQSWQATPTRPGPDFANVTSVLADPSDTLHVLVGMTNGVVETHDGGHTWTVATGLARPGTVFALLRTGRGLVAVSSEQHVDARGYIDGNRLGVYWAPTGTTTWQAVTTPPDAHGGLSVAADIDESLLIGTTAGVWRLRLP